MPRRAASIGELLNLVFLPVVWAFRPFIGRKRAPPEMQYTADDIRYTTKDRSLFAFAMAWPASGKLLLRSITSGQVHAVQLLQTREALHLTQQPDGLSIQLPAQQVGDHAFALRILGVA